MESADLIEAFVSYGQTVGIVPIEELRDQAFASLFGGNGSDIISTNENGKSVGFAISIPAAEMFFVTTTALRVLSNRGGYSTTTPDFRYMGNN